MGQSSLPELLAHDVPVEVPGDRPGDDEREDPGLSGVVESQKSVEQRHLAESRSGKVMNIQLLPIKGVSNTSEADPLNTKDATL